MSERRIVDLLYWLVVSLCIVIGVLGIFSIGMPFLLIGATLGVVAPFRGERHRFWPPLVAVVLFIAGYVLVAPLGCTTSATISETSAVDVQEGSTTCTNLLGIDYSRPGIYNPPLWPALLAASMAAAAGFVASRILLGRRR